MSKTGDRGFTLVEVMISILILTVGLLSLAQLMVHATNANMLSGRLTSSSTMARDQLERLKAAPFYTDIESRTRNPILQPGGDLDAPEAGYVQYYTADGIQTNAGNAQYEVRWRINDAPSQMPLEMLRIEVRCVPSAGMSHPSAIIGEARFVTYRTANIG
ncbi:MAG: prepilin-type N-terminal cleavage/methylation domain-containing protein [Acidobacteria bacterium]|nr:MAG: prepilin-type N-terminal cleavage/methylation domain-containing protein [Acidobacteriota bacterium]